MKFRTVLMLFTLAIFSNTLLAESFYDFSFKDSEKKTFNFSSLKGKTVLLVNIATQCGYTDQLDDLEKVYKKYNSKNFTIIGIPSNDFRSQAPESSEEIGKFCRLKYGTSFPIMEKVTILGKNKTPLYKWVHTQPGNEEEIGWNFEKILINKNGKIVKRFKSRVNPLDEELTKNIEQFL